MASSSASSVATTTWSTNCTSLLPGMARVASTSTASASSDGDEQHLARVNRIPREDDWCLTPRCQTPLRQWGLARLAGLVVDQVELHRQLDRPDGGHPRGVE